MWSYPHFVKIFNFKEYNTMSKKAKYFSFAIAIIAVAAVMTIAIYAATAANAGITAGVSWTASAGIEFELEAWAVNNSTQNGIGATTVPKAIAKQVVDRTTTNTAASGLGGDLSCAFYDGTDDGVNNPNNIIFTYKVTNTGDSVILIKAIETPTTADEEGTTADTHKPAIALSVEIDGIVKGAAVNKVIGSEGYKIQPGSIFVYKVILSIANADVNITSFDAGVQFSMELSSGETIITLSREEVLYSQNGTTVAGTTTGGTAVTYTYYGAYPQTYVGESLNSTLKSALEAGTLEATGKSYTTDINGTSTILPEYLYQDNYYAYLASADAYETGYTFTTDETITDGIAYFFKVEPLKWTNHNGTYLCEQSIASMRFSNSSVLWSESEVRTWLNEVFYVEAGIDQFKTTKTTIQNNTTAGEKTDGAGTPTDDYVWLPSYAEMTSWYGAGNFKNGNTDLTKATYGYYDTSESATRWWFRTASDFMGIHVWGGRCDGTSMDFVNSECRLCVRPCFAL